MLISDSLRFVFIHVPKTGGSSIDAALGPDALARRSGAWASLLRALGLPRDYRRFRFGKHGSLASVERVMPAETFRSYFKFAFVRNPWDRLVSEYNALLHKPHHRRHRRVAGPSGFPGYLRHEAPRTIACQVDLLVDSSGAIGVDLVGRYETLTESFRQVCERLGVQRELPHLNRHEHADYREYYDDASRELVRQRWGRDVEAFGYEF